MRHSMTAIAREHTRNLTRGTRFADCTAFPGEILQITVSDDFEGHRRRATAATTAALSLHLPDAQESLSRGLQGLRRGLQRGVCSVHEGRVGRRLPAGRAAARRVVGEPGCAWIAAVSRHRFHG